MPVDSSCSLGRGVTILHPELVNLYGCQLSAGVMVGPFVEIQKGVSVGECTRIQSHTFVCEGVSIGKRVLIGHGVIFINDRYPIANNPDWSLEETFVEDDVSIGSGAIIMSGVRIGVNSRIGAGAVVTKDVKAGATVVGVPARAL